jgi:hypothetical protein
MIAEPNGMTTDETKYESTIMRSAIDHTIDRTTRLGPLVFSMIIAIFLVAVSAFINDSKRRFAIIAALVGFFSVMYVITEPNVYNAILSGIGIREGLTFDTTFEEMKLSGRMKGSIGLGE